jgi:Asp-tRNA(Asn)/Glu-tRNA(Gln) amidotransferase A subunit family amidase
LGSETDGSIGKPSQRASLVGMKGTYKFIRIIYIFIYIYIFI